MWKQDNIDLGKVTIGKKNTVEFVYIGEGEYVSATTSCGCTTADWDEATRSLKTTYVPKPVPYHLKAEGKTSYNSVKSIKVKMLEDGKNSLYMLEFKAKVHE